MMKNERSGATHPRRGLVRVCALAWALLGCACGGLSLDDGDPSTEDSTTPIQQALRAVLDGQGGEIVGRAGSSFEGVRLTIPKGALRAPTEITIKETSVSTPLPKSAIAVGRTFALEPTGLALTAPAAFTVPFDEEAVAARRAIPKEVRLWLFDGQAWSQQLQDDSSDDRVTVRLATLVGGVTPGVVAEDDDY